MLMVTTNILLDCSIALLNDVPLTALLTDVHCDTLALRFSLPWWNPGVKRRPNTKTKQRLKAQTGSFLSSSPTSSSPTRLINPIRHRDCQSHPSPLSFRPTILSAPLRPRLPPSILMLRVLAGHGCRQHPAPANLLFVTVQTFRKDERRSDANEWQRLNDQRRRGSRPKALSHVGAGFKPCQKIGNGSKPKGKARQWTDG